MKKPIRLLLLGLITTFMFVPSANAQRAYCNTHDHILEQLTNKHKETRTAMGLSIDEKRLIELFTSKDGKWTLLISDKNGKTCVIGAGKSWVELPEGSSS